MLSTVISMAESIQAKVQDLGDLELAILVCLVAQEHCLFSTGEGSTYDLQEELRQICLSTFGLRPVVVECSAATTLDDFSEGILVDSFDDGDDVDQQGRPDAELDSSSRPQPGHFGSNMLDNRCIADVIIATNLDLACENVQVQALELVRTKRIFTRRAMHTTSKDFMILAITSKPGLRLFRHLNDMFCMSHVHAVEDGLPYSNGDLSKETATQFTREDIADLRILAEDAAHTPEIAAYMHNIVVFMRNNRFIKGGVTATTTRQLRKIAKTLAPLHGLDYVPPSLVALAVRKLYPHRLRLATMETERSLQWGSDPAAIKQLLEGVTVEDAIEDVLATVQTPL